MPDVVDVAVLGAGVVGAAIARELGARGLSVALLEREPRVGIGVSSRNSGVIHSGLYYPPGSLKARCCVRGNALLYEWVGRRAVPHARLGKLVVAPAVGDLEALEALAQRAMANGAPGVELVGPTSVARSEPHLPAVAGALRCPMTGIVDPWELTRSLVVDAGSRGVLVALAAGVVGVEERGGEGFRAQTTRGPLDAARLVNAAGLDAGRVAALLGFDGPTIHPCRGDYFRLRSRQRYSHLVYPVRAPTDLGLGVHLTLDLGGRFLLGPDAEYVTDAIAVGPADHKLDRFLEAGRRLLGPLAPEQLSWETCGIRPKLRGPADADERDFALLEGPPGCLHLFGIDSPGLTSCLALAEVVAERMLG